MNLPPLFYAQVMAHALCEWGVTWALATWVARAWTREPAPLVVRLARHRERAWFMIGFGIASPLVVAILSAPLAALFQRPGGTSAWIAISYLLSILYGVFIGLAVVCCTAPAEAQRPFRPRPAVTLSAALILASFLAGLFLRFERGIYTIVELLLATVVLLVARNFFDTSDFPPTAAAPPPLPQRKLAPALLLGFLPSALILATIAVASAANLSRDVSTALLWVCCLVSIFCCFGAAIILFSRKNGGAIAGGIAFLLLNAFIAFFFGCCATVNLNGFH